MTETAHTCPGGRVTAPVMTLKFGSSHGQVAITPFSLPYTQRPVPVSADVLHRVECALHIEERDAATIGFYDLAATLSLVPTKDRLLESCSELILPAIYPV